MAGLNHLFDLYRKKGKEFIDNIFSKYVIINEKMDASAFILEKNKENKINYYKRKGNTPINKIDRILARYYEKPINHFETLDQKIKARIPKGWVFGFEYFADNNPVEIKYDRIPLNNLILSYIHIKDDKGKIKKTIQNKEDLDNWAEILEVSPPPIIFQGFLNNNQKVSILDFLDTPFEDLIKRFKTESFVKYIITILNPKLKKTFLNNTLDSKIEGIVFRFGKNEEEVVLAKLVDPAFTELARRKSRDKINKKPNDIYNLTVLDVMNFIMVNIRKFKIKGRGFEDRYISFICEVFNKFIDLEGDKYKDLDFEVPNYLRKDYFKAGIDFIDNSYTKELIEQNDSFEQLFKIMIASFRKKKRKSNGIFDRELINQFNGVVDRIHDYIMGIKEAEEIPTFGEYVSNIPYDIEEETSNTFLDDLENISNTMPDGDKSKNWGKKKINIIVGRFQPFHNGHLKMAEEMYKINKLPTVLVCVNNGKNASGKSPLSKFILDHLFKSLIEDEQYIKDYIFVDSGFVINIIDKIRPEYEPIIWAAGEDRIEGYKKQIEFITKNNKSLHPDFKFILTDRLTSSSAIRNYIENNDFAAFKSLVPSSIQSEWILIKNSIDESNKIYENSNSDIFDNYFDLDKNDLSTLHYLIIGNIKDEKTEKRIKPKYLEALAASQASKYYDIIENEIIGNLNNDLDPLIDFKMDERHLIVKDVEKYFQASDIKENEIKILAKTIQFKTKIPQEIINNEKSLFELNWKKLSGEDNIGAIKKFLRYKLPKSEDGRGELYLSLFFEGGKLPKYEGDLEIEGHRFEIKHNGGRLGGTKGFTDGNLKLLRNVIQDKTYIDILEDISMPKIEKNDLSEKKKIWALNLKSNNGWKSIIENKSIDKNLLCEAFVEYFCERWQNLRGYPDLLKETEKYFKEFTESEGNHDNGVYPLGLINAKYYQRIEEFKGIILIGKDCETIFFNPSLISLKEFKNNIKISSFNWDHYRTGKGFEIKKI